METKDVIRTLREDKNLTQAQLAKEVHYSLSVVNKWENGKKNPSVDAIKILAQYFDVSIYYILGMEE